MNTPIETGTQLAGSQRGFFRRFWRRVSGADARLANGLLTMLSAEMVYKADCFDYLCWLEETGQSERVPGVDYLVMASDGTTCWGKTYSEAVKVAMHHDKELYDAVRDLEAHPPNALHELPPPCGSECNQDATGG